MTKRWKLLYQPHLGNSWGRLLFLHQLVNIACDLETVCGKVSSCPGSPQGLADFKASSEWFDRAITSPTSARVKLSKYLKKKNNKKLTRAIAQRVQDRKWERLNRFKLGSERQIKWQAKQGHGNWKQCHLSGVGPGRYLVTWRCSGPQF